MSHTKLDITGMTYAKGPMDMLFTIKANGIPLQVSCKLKDFYEDHEKTMEKVNENFRNTLRYIKLYGKLPKGRISPKKLAVWTSTDTGISCRGSKLPVPEFIPFKL